MSSRHVAIIGGGYSGALLAVNLLRSGTARVTLIEKAGQVARGAAYSTPRPEHILNVRAGRMSAFADAPDHFEKWLSKTGQGDAASFAERRVYGRYLQELLDEASAEAGDRLHLVRDEAVAVERRQDGEIVTLASGASIPADAVILSVGNLPGNPPGIAPDLSPDVYIGDPWAGDIAQGLAPGDRVALIGTGLTAIDAALTLDASGFAGEIVAISRRGMVPRAHADGSGHPEALAEQPEGELSALVTFMRGQAEQAGWRDAVDSIRVHTQPLWASASPEWRKRFLRHLRPYWDVHRHRIAPSVAARIADMEARGSLRFAAGKIVSTQARGAGAILTWRPRGSAAPESLPVRRIVNCTGPQGDLAHSTDPLLAQLLRDGRIRPDPCRIGIDIDGESRAVGADGQPSATLYAIGPMTRGALWEIVAVPDLRVQTQTLARQLGGGPWTTLAQAGSQPAAMDL